MRRLSIRNLSAAAVAAATVLTVGGLPGAAHAAEPAPAAPAAPAVGWFTDSQPGVRPIPRDVPSFGSQGGYNKLAGDTAEVHCSILGERGPDGNRIWWRVYDPTRTTAEDKGY
ncbi:hypothetical protein [Streptomyces sp. NPDC050164]|uniref:hypothetical protein n=1 Tax=Streptomyces sp. NPDC050164 TaxID=3365605 RepID=UPI0037BB6371